MSTQEAAQELEVHISSIIVWAKAGTAPAVAQLLSTWSGVQIHGATADDKLILTLEADQSGEMFARVDAIRELPQVLAVPAPQTSMPRHSPATKKPASTATKASPTNCPTWKA